MTSTGLPAANELLTLDNCELDGLLDPTTDVLSLLEQVDSLLTALTGGEQRIAGRVMPGAHVADRPMYISSTCTVEPGAVIMGECYLGDGVVVRGGAYIREGTIVLSRGVIGHASEIKHSLFLPGAKAPHFAYVGDSILGRDVNLGAGTKLSNFKINNSQVGIPTATGLILTEMRKLGAILGDRVQTGCNSVTSPGTIMGRDCLLYPNATARAGVYDAGSVIR